MRLQKFSNYQFCIVGVLLTLIAVLPKNAVAQGDSAVKTTQSISTSQASTVSNFRFGIHASPSISFISTKDNNVETSANVKFGFGLMAIYNFAENYAFSSGINIVSRGGDMNSLVGDSVTYNGDYSTQFLQLPFALRMSTREFGYKTFFASFGGSVDIKLSEEVSFSPELPDPLDSYVRFFNAMFIIGAGMEYNMGGNTSLVAGIYYNRSLIDNLVEDNEHLLVNKSNVYQFDYVCLQVGILF